MKDTVLQLMIVKSMPPLPMIQWAQVYVLDTTPALQASLWMQSWKRSQRTPLTLANTSPQLCLKIEYDFCYPELDTQEIQKKQSLYSGANSNIKVI